jgi:hypothetical protein
MALFSFFITIVGLILVTFVVIGIITFKKLQPLYKWLFFYMLMALIFHVLSNYFGFVYGNNQRWIQAYGFFELLIFIFIYRLFLLKQLSGMIFMIVGFIGLLYMVGENVLTNFYDLKNVQYYSRAIDAFMIVLASVLYFLEQIGRTKTVDISKMILNGAIFVYFSLNLIIILPINYFINADTQLTNIFMISNMITTTLFYIYLTYSLWKNGKIQKPLRTGLEL